MIDILYPFKMDNLSEAYSSMYEALNPKLQAIQDKAQADVKKRAAEKQATEKRTAAFQDYKKQQTEKGAKPHEVLDGWKGGKGQIGPMKKEGRYRAEWEQLKLMEKDDYRETFDTWLTGLAEEGYDIDRWSDEELVETFINENDLWGSRDMVLEALLEIYKGKHGQSEKEYQDSRSDGGKMVSGDSKRSGAAYSSRAVKNTGPNPAGGSTKPQGQGRMTSGQRTELEYRKANLKNSHEPEGEHELSEEDKKGKGSGTKDACYHKVKSRYSVWPSAYASGALVKCRKKGAKNWGNSSKKEGFSDWRNELNLIDENRMAAYNAGAGEGNEDRGISKSLADKMGRYNDESAFSRRKTSGKFNKDYNKNVLKDKKPRSNTTGRGTPQQYRKGYEDSEMGRYQSKIVQGKGSIKDLGKKK